MTYPETLRANFGPAMEAAEWAGDSAALTKYYQDQMGPSEALTDLYNREMLQGPGVPGRSRASAYGPVSYNEESLGLDRALAAAASTKADPVARYLRSRPVLDEAMEDIAMPREESVRALRGMYGTADMPARRTHDYIRETSPFAGPDQTVTAGYREPKLTKALQGEERLRASRADLNEMLAEELAAPAAEHREDWTPINDSDLRPHSTGKGVRVDPAAGETMRQQAARRSLYGGPPAVVDPLEAVNLTPRGMDDRTAWQLGPGHSGGVMPMPDPRYEAWQSDAERANRVLEETAYRGATDVYGLPASRRVYADTRVPLRAVDTMAGPVASMGGQVERDLEWERFNRR